MPQLMIDPAPALDGRRRRYARKQALWTEREAGAWVEHWRDIAQYQYPRAGKFDTSDTNRGGKKHTLVYDNTAIFSRRTLAAGMMSGVTSPARPWFRMGLSDKDLMEFDPVKQWLHDTAQLMRAVFASSNTYGALQQGYEELGAFGTWANIILPDFDNVIHHYPLTIGEYALAANNRGQVDTVCREMKMTVASMVEEFGLSACSQTVQSLWRAANYDTWIDVIHLIQPRRKRDQSLADSKNMPWESVYFEPSRDDFDTYLRESGFRQFPAVCPRWSIRSNNVYGDSPGMECLGDVKQLQFEQVRKSEAIDYKVRPPLQIPTQYADQAHKALPGGRLFVDQVNPNGGIRTAFEVQLDLQHIRESIEDVRERIRRAYHADLFLLISNDTRSNITATEIAERHEEKLLMLGPVLERLQNELLAPLVELTYQRMAEAKILPEAPREIQGLDMEIEFISVMAQAQRLVATRGMDKLVTNVVQLAAVKPEIIDKINFDEYVDSTADAYGVDPKLIVDDAQVEEIRQARAQQMAAQQAAAAAPVVADTAKTASEIDADGIQDVMGLLQGYNSPSPAFTG